MRTSGIVRKLRQMIGIDRAVGFALLGRSWSALAGIATLGFLVHFLTPKQQGYYSTFGSFMALQVFFELGLSLVLMQFASHERAGLEWTPQRTLEGDPVAKARLSSLLRRGMLWYGLMSLAVLALIYPVGMVYFRHYGQGGVPVDWQGPWLFLSVAVSGGLLFTPLWAVLEGSGLVAEVVAAQFVGAVLNSLLFWLMLFRHWGLYAAPIGGIASSLWVVGWLVARQRGFLWNLWRAAKPGVEVSWREEIWPFQWKIALSWLSGYFIFRTFNLILFAALGPVAGPVAAGQMGVSLSVTTAISAIALGWVATKAAPFGSLVARRDWAQMDRMFFPCLWQSTTALVLGETAFWLLRLGLHHVHNRVDGRLLAPLPLALLMGATVVSHIAAAQAIYLRAHKQEPFLIPSLLGGVLVSLSSLLLCRPFGATGMMAGYLTVSLAVGLGLGTAIFVQKRREWHGPPPSGNFPPGSRPPALAEPGTVSR
jgi:hypothetical protein